MLLECTERNRPTPSLNHNKDRTLHEHLASRILCGQYQSYLSMQYPCYLFGQPVKVVALGTGLPMNQTDDFDIVSLATETPNNLPDISW